MAQGTGDGYRTAEVLALKNSESGETYLFAYNHDINRRDITEQEMTVVLSGPVSEVQKAVIDESHTSPLKAWKEMGSPAYPSKEQLAQMHEASELRYESLGAVKEIRFTAKSESVTILKIR